MLSEILASLRARLLTTSSLAQETVRDGQTLTNSFFQNVVVDNTPQLNGKVERSHRSDGQEFYQLLSYKGDVDLEAKLGEWESFYNVHRPHRAHDGKTPYEVLREKL